MRNQSAAPEGEKFSGAWGFRELETGREMAIRKVASFHIKVPTDGKAIDFEEELPWVYELALIQQP
jgi:hypothetical protein